MEKSTFQKKTDCRYPQNPTSRRLMNKKPTRWNAERVTLVPKANDEERRKELLTELAQIFYDLSCQFPKSSSPTIQPHFEGQKNRRPHE